MPNALPIKALKVRSLDIERKEVTWEIPATSIDVWDYTMQVLRSESPEGPFDAITEPFIDRYIFVDAAIPTGHKFRQLWYRLRVVHKATGLIADHGPVTHEAEPDLIASYVRKNEQVLFTQFAGRQCWLFKKRTFGTRCRSCFDSKTNKRTRANCLDCFDTGFIRGYLNPMEIWVQVDPPGKSKQNHSQQINQESYTTARMTHYPSVIPGDVLVEAENRRWRVMKTTQSERLRAPIKQELAMLQIQETDIEYKLPLNLETALRDIQPSPPRMFVNATDLAAAIEERTPNVFANYATFPKDAPEE